MLRAANNKAGGDTGAAKPPLRARFKAWWEGYDLRPATARIRQPQTAGHHVRYEPPKQRWETARLRLVQDVWGEGFCSPGAAEHIHDLAKYLALDPALSVLDLGAGLGGATRAMCEHFGVWVTGLEADPNLAEAGMALSVKAGLAKRASIAAFDPDHFEYKSKSIDCVFSKEFFFTVADKQAFLRRIEDLLKSRGQLLFTDYVLARAGLRSTALDRWIAQEPRPPHPWSVDDYRRAFADLHLDIRVVEDVTPTVRALITRCWAGYLATHAGGIEPELIPHLIDEVEIWARRARVLEAGDLMVCRFHVLKRDTERLLSDWERSG